MGEMGRLGGEIKLPAYWLTKLPTPLSANRERARTEKALVVGRAEAGKGGGVGLVRGR